MREELPSFKITIRDVDCDCCLVEFYAAQRRVQVAAIYRSATATISDAGRFSTQGIRKIVDLMDPSAECFVAVDENLCLLDSATHRRTDEFCESIVAKGFVSLNDTVPTRITDSTESLIDHVWVRCKRYYGHNVSIKDFKGVSDHCLIDIDFYIDVRAPTNLKTVRSYFNYGRLKCNLDNLDGGDCCES